MRFNIIPKLVVTFQALGHIIPTAEVQSEIRNDGRDNTSDWKILNNLMNTISGPWRSFRESSETCSGPEVGFRHQVAHREEHVDHGGLVGSHLLRSVPLILRPQLRFERHPSVHKLFLTALFLQNKPPANLPRRNPLPPHLIFYVLMYVSQI